MTSPEHRPPPSPFCAVCDRPIRDQPDGTPIHTGTQRVACYPNMRDDRSVATRRK